MNESNFDQYSLFGRRMNLRCTLGPELQIEVWAPLFCLIWQEPHPKKTRAPVKLPLCWGSFTKMLAFLPVSRKHQAQQGYSPWKKKEENDNVCVRPAKLSTPPATRRRPGDGLCSQGGRGAGTPLAAGRLRFAFSPHMPSGFSMTTKGTHASFWLVAI